MLWPVRLALVLCLASSLWARQSSPPVSSSKTPSSSDASGQQPSQPDQQANSPSDQNKPRSESKIKRELKDLEPQCIGIAGGSGKCRHTQENTANTKQEEQERQVRQECSDAANQNQPQCVDLRKRDSAHDVAVGDDYLSDKHYPSAENRYRLALQEDPTNATAMLHLAQVLEKLHRNAEAAEQYQKFLATDPPDPEAKKARAALQKLGGYRPAPPTS